jgi:hypothetical protein
MSRLPHYLDNLITDGGKVATLTRRPPSAPRKISGTHFCWRLSRPQDHSAAGSIYHYIGITSGILCKTQDKQMKENRVSSPEVSGELFL